MEAATAIQSTGARAQSCHTGQKLLDACEAVLCEAANVQDVTVRRIALKAHATPSAISYHFGSLEELIIATGRRAYLRLNAERLSLLQAAVARRAPEPADPRELIEALVGPSVRWSLDPNSSYRVLHHMTVMEQTSRDRERYQPIIEDIDHHRAFVPHLKRIAPWLDEAEIGFRLSCALGVRSQVIRSRGRTAALSNHAIDLSDPDVVIARMVDAIVPMFVARG
ncbi:AcrR family transcriptional regulator [Amorphus suaedae]